MHACKNLCRCLPLFVTMRASSRVVRNPRGFLAMTSRCFRWTGLVLGLALAASVPATAQFAARPQTFAYETAATDPPPVKTQHSITVGGKTLSYTAEVGKIAVPDASGKTMGHMFYVAYILDNPDPSHPRPVTFSYNGGPGSDSVYVHMGGFGPRRVVLQDNGNNPPPPYTIVDNADTWLDSSDLVFIDAIGTGYSRATSHKNLVYASSAQGDLECFAQFVRLWLYDNNRLNSPLILAGESYGTFRSAGLADVLWQHHIPVSGIVLLSSVLNMATLRPSYSNDRPYWLALPTQTAIAWHFHKLAPQYQKMSLPDAVKASEEWAQTKYEHYLDLGDALQGAQRQQALQEMSGFTGLSPQFLDSWNLRVSTALFDASLLRGQRETIGRYDGTQIGTSQTPGQTRPDYDASDLLGVPYLHEFVSYMENELDYKTTLEYGDRGMGGAGIERWNYNISSGGFGNFFGGAGDDVSQDLERVFAQNPSMRLMLCEGYFDQATPMLEATYSMRHLFITPAEQSHISIEHYLSGHMIYAHKDSREKLHRDFGAFVKTLPGVAQ
ncbi:MAG: peptidase S10 [Acidobacteria bacterium]|nr:MAG: peptidase S10 [Acidobacteriota bacterium]